MLIYDWKVLDGRGYFVRPEFRKDGRSDKIIHGVARSGEREDQKAFVKPKKISFDGEFTVVIDQNEQEYRVGEPNNEYRKFMNAFCPQRLQDGYQIIIEIDPITTAEFKDNVLTFGIDMTLDDFAPSDFEDRALGSLLSYAQQAIYKVYAYLGISKMDIVNDITDCLEELEAKYGIGE